MAKHLSEDEVTLVVNAKADKAQQNIRKFSKEIDNHGERNKSLQRQMESLELAGKKNTDSWKQRREEYGRNATQIRNLKQQIAAETKVVFANAKILILKLITTNLYNKLVWPILYKHLFPELRYGFTDEVRNSLHNQLSYAIEKITKLLLVRFKDIAYLCRRN